MRLGKPPAQPVPIWMAALGERMAAAAQELADGLCLFMVGPGLIREIVGGKDSMCRITVVPGEGEAVRAAARRLVTTYALVPFYARVMARQGFAEEVKAIGERWAAGDRAAAPGQVSDAMLRELVLTGSLDDIAAGVERYREAGLGCPVLAITSDFDRVLVALAPGQN
jgi:alkanesulfonate monooxygenase SsuD/methylene tetrahydromethanopterin reductase-like flavin-dependent oxidoreductase (luciferase family)